jgi:ring-1,2-phenylacetyl-CoA epoxidase subunit PaaE
MAKVLDGEVAMDVDFALSDEEKEEGYVLTCQGRAKSKNVSVNYDL